VATRDIRHDRAGRQTFSGDPRLFHIRPMLPSCRASYHIKPASVGFP
jgi:hypothetical protein